MKSMTMVLVLLGMLTGFLLWMPGEQQRTDSYREALAMNYATFRNAVFLHVFTDGNGNKRPGDIDLPEVLLPHGWQPLRTWRARVFSVADNAPLRCAIWGEASAEEIERVRRVLFRDSFAVGRAEGGRLVPGHGAVVPVPDFVPEGSLVSILDLD